MVLCWGQWAVSRGSKYRLLFWRLLAIKKIASWLERFILLAKDIKKVRETEETKEEKLAMWKRKEPLST